MLADTPDGSALAFYRSTSGVTNRDVYVLPLDGNQRPELFLGTPYEDRGVSFSPNGRWLAYVSAKSGQDEIYVRPYPGPGGETIVSSGGGQEAVWGPDGMYAERVNQGYFMDIKVDRQAIARYGLAIEDVQDVIQSALGGQNVTHTIEGRERYPVNVRYARAFREDLPAIRRVLVRTPTGAQIPLGQLAGIDFTPGPAMIRDEDGQLAGYVYVDTATSDIGGYVDDARRAIADELQLPPGYTLAWTGQYEFQLRARERLQVLIPIVFVLIFLLLYMTFHSVSEAAIVMLSVVYAMTGGVILQWWLGYNFSVAVWVGYIALYGVAVQTGVVMVVYLHEALDRRLRVGGAMTEDDIRQATLEGSVLRLRPKLMTVGVTLAALLPILWSTGVGSDVMKPIAAPIVGGMITSTIHVLVITPVIFFITKRRAWRRGKLAVSGMARS